jgi:hypothetical protein
VDFSVFSQPNRIHSETLYTSFGRPVLVGLKPNKPPETRRVEVDLKRVGTLRFSLSSTRWTAPTTQQRDNASAASTSSSSAVLESKSRLK